MKAYIRKHNPGMGARTLPSRVVEGKNLEELWDAFMSNKRAYEFIACRKEENVAFFVKKAKESGWWRPTGAAGYWR